MRQFLSKFTLAALAGAMFVATCATSNADVISWSTSDLFAGGDNTGFVSTNGTGLLAFNGTTSATGAVTANGVAFNNVDQVTALAGYTQSAITYTAATSTENLNAFTGGDFADADAVALLQGAHFNVESFTLSGLTVGETYELQILAHDGRDRNNNWDMGFNAGNGGTTVAVVGDLNNDSDNNGDSFIGTWSALTTTQTVTLTATRSGNIAVGDDITIVPNGGQRQIQALQLRTIAAVPEPSSLLALAMGSLVFVVRRRR